MAITRKEMKDATRQRLLSAGAKVFAADGVQGARIADIAREAEIAMGTLYSHFPDKDALFRELMQREVVDAIADLRVPELLEGQAEGWIRRDIDPKAAARCEVGAVFHLLDWWIDNPDQYTAEQIVDQLCIARRFGVEGGGALSDGGSLPPASAAGSMTP